MYKTLEKTRYRELALDILFWMHIGVIIFSLFIGLLVSLTIALLLILLHRIHIIVFKECLLSKLHKYLGGLSSDISFLQFASLKLLRKKISLQQSNRLDYGFVLIYVTIAVLHSF